MEPAYKRVRELREEIAELSLAYQRNMDRKDALTAMEQRRRVERLQEIKVELFTFMDRKAA
jgi:hypothetical protein